MSFFRRILRLEVIVSGLVIISPCALGQVATAPDTPEPGSIEEIARATTETRFLSPWVAYLPHSDERAFAARVPASHSGCTG